jgi:hypothetical protein
MAETPRFAHLVVLMFLGSAFCLAVGTMVLFYAAARRRSLLGLVSTVAVCGLLLGYFGVLVGVSLASPERTLPVGGWKYFCEIDCHIAHSVQSSYTAAMLGPEASPVVAKGMFVVVKLETWFDANSISKFRGDGPLTPGPRRVFLVDDAGRRFEPWPGGKTAALQPGTPLTTALRPGESYWTNFVFDVPNGSVSYRLLITKEADAISKLVIDDENSLLHRKIYLGLGERRLSYTRKSATPDAPAFDWQR